MSIAPVPSEPDALPQAPLPPLRLDDFRNPVWLEDGMKVRIRFGPQKTSADGTRTTTPFLLCTVETAAGDVGRVVNTYHNVRRILPLAALYVHHTDVHARPARLPPGL